MGKLTAKRLILLTIILTIELSLLPVFSQQVEAEPQGIVPKPPGHSALEVDISTNKFRYLPEEEVEITYELNQQAYLYLFSFDPGGEVNLLFPNKYDRDNQMEAGEGQLPGKGYSFITDKAEGAEYFQVIASKKELPVFPSPPPPGSDAAPFPTLGDNPEKFAAGISGEIEQVVDEAWTTDWTEIEVTKRTGRLSITSSPSNAKIYIDEDFVSRTPATIDVRPGYRQVRLSLGADLRWTREVRVKSNQVKRLEAHLERVEYATLSITSDPSRAKIYVDGQYRGKTPRSISIEAKELTIELRKEGYSDWQRELRLFPRESREINADLPVEVVSKPNLDLDVSFGLGLNLGGFVDEPLSPGLELALNDLIVGTSVYGSGDPELPERINWEEEDFSGEKLDYGPEWEIYLGYPVEIYESLYLRAGAGLAIQPQAQLEQLETVSTTSTVKAITEVARDAQPVFEVNPTLHGGFHLERQGFSLQITYQSRRGPVIGFGYKF